MTVFQVSRLWGSGVVGGFGLFSAAGCFSEAGVDQGFVGGDTADLGGDAGTRRRRVRFAREWAFRACGGFGFGAGEGLGGAGAQDADLFWGAAAAGAESGAVHGVAGDAEVAAYAGDDVGDWAAEDVVVDVGGFDAIDEFGLECGGLVVVVGLEFDDVLDVADDGAAGGGDGVGRVRDGGSDELGEVVLDHDGAADGAGGAVVGLRQGGGLVLVGLENVARVAGHFDADVREGVEQGLVLR